VVCDERKNGITNEFQMNLRNVDPNGRNVAERNAKSMQFIFLENCWNWARKQGSKVFSEWDSFSACKTSLFIYFTSLIGMEWIKASLVGMNLYNIGNFLLFSEKNLKKFFVLPALP
jgi:hypothetical protein